MIRARRIRPYTEESCCSAPPRNNLMSEKLQKVLARAGYASRRTIETWIAAGRLTVNGTLAKLGDRVTNEDAILLDGKPLEVKFAHATRRVLAFHKPEGVICTRSDEQGRRTVFEDLPRLRSARWVAVGRLDINTNGLLLLTTDGELAHRLMHPSAQVEREYAVRVFGNVDAAMLERMRTGVMLEDGRAHFDDIVDAGGSGLNHWFHVILKEGRQREVRRLWESQGVQVSRLIRVRYGNIALRRGLKPGKWDELEAPDITALMELAGLKVQEEPKASEQRKTSKKKPVAKAPGRKSASSPKKSGKARPKHR